MQRARRKPATCAACSVLLPRADIGREVIADELRKQGADVTEVVAYRTVVAEPEREGEPDIYRMLLERRIDVVTFTSASAVRNFVRVLGAEPAADLLRTTVVASIGPVTAEAAAQCEHPDDDHAGAATRSRRWSTRSSSTSSSDSNRHDGR